MMIWLLMIDFTLGSLTCPKYKCAKSGQLSQGVCVALSSGTYFVSECTDSTNSFCLVSETSNSTCVAPSKTRFAYPGERCSKETDCVHGTCIRGYCFAQELYSTCKESGECNPGLNCGKGLGHCVALITQAYSDCDSEFDCDDDMTCDNGKCAPYFGKGNNGWISNCTEGLSTACESGQCLFGLCVEGARTKGGYPRKCVRYTDCYSDDYLDQGVKLYTNCSCGLNPSGTGYCELFPGDKAYREYIAVRKDWIKLGLLRNCNTIRRFSRECIASHYDKSFAYLFEYKMLKALYYPVIYGAESCVLKVIEPRYYKDYEEVEDNNSAAGLVLLMLAAFSFI